MITFDIYENILINFNEIGPSLKPKENKEILVILFLFDKQIKNHLNFLIIGVVFS